MPPMKADEDTQTTDLNKVLDSLNTEQRHTIVKAFMAIESERSFQGKQVDHRIKTEGNIISGGLIESRRGQWMGYSIVIILIAMSALLAILGHDWVAGGMMTAAIALAVVFVLHQNPKSENVAEQEKNN